MQGFCHVHWAVPKQQQWRVTLSAEGCSCCLEVMLHWLLLKQWSERWDESVVQPCARYIMIWYKFNKSNFNLIIHRSLQICSTDCECRIRLWWMWSEWHVGSPPQDAEDSQEMKPKDKHTQQKMELLDGFWNSPTYIRIIEHYITYIHTYIT